MPIVATSDIHGHLIESNETDSTTNKTISKVMKSRSLFPENKIEQAIPIIIIKRQIPKIG